jgi:serine/threonine protein kinase/tetratricopeptide (TPR) repeat protein
LSTATTYRACPACQARILHETVHCPNCGHDVSDLPWREGDPYVGVVLEGRYAIDGLLGIGGMGRVYRATQTSLGKPFAIKILHPHLTDDPDSRARFAAEAHNAASLNHPNVVSVVDYGRSKEGITYIVMEYVEGQTLEAIVHEQYPLPRERVMDLCLQILSALGEAHGLGILHRDLKPENIIVQQLRTHGEVLKVLDFGIAKLMEQNDARPGLTGRGMVCGTPEYMSPEQARGLTLDARSDLYAVGIILYQLLTGSLPFQADSPVDLLHMQIHQPPQPPHLVAGRAPDVLDDICLKAIAKERETRFSSAAEFRDALVGATPSVSAARTSCSSCGAPLSSTDRFCSSCGTPVTARPRAAPSGGARRRQTRLSHTALTAGGRERTAEMIVRAFPLPLAGRDPLIHAARGRFAEPANGLVTQILRGSPGSGRTRLVEEMLTLAEGAGWRTYFVGAEPSGAAPPLWPIRHVIAEVLGVDPITVTTQELGRASNLVGLAREALPGLAELFGLGGPVHGSEYAVRRRECFASVVQTLAAAGRGAPLVLAFDDVDLYDGASRQVVQRLARARAPSSVLVLATSSEQDLAWLNGPVLDISALDAESVRALVQEVVEAINPTSSLPAVLAERAPISPLRLELQLRLLAQGASLPARDDEAALVHARLALLEPMEHAIVEVGSVLGERFAESDLVHVLHALPEGITTPTLEGALQRLHAMGMLTLAGRGERSFAHRHVRDLVYASVSPARKQLLHRLAAHHALAAKLDITVQAMHLLKCGDPEVVEILVDAAERATRAFDDRKAINLLRAARRAFNARTSTASTPARRDHEITSRVVETLRFTGNAEDAVALAMQALAAGPDDDVAVDLSRSLARALAALGRPAEALPHFQAALAGFIATGQREEILTTYAELGQAYARSGDPTRGVAELTEGLDLMTFGEGPRADVGVSMWRYLLSLVDLEFARGNLREARTWCEHAIFQAELRREELGVLRTHARMADMLRALDQGTLAESHLGRALDESRYLGDRLTTAELLLSRGDLRLRRGHVAEARHCYDEAERLALVVDWRDGLARAHDALARMDAASHRA